MVIKGYNVVPLLKKTVKEIGEDRIPSIAAETAYYFFFSLFPLLLFLTPLLGLVGNGQQLMESMLGRLSATMPADTLALLRRVLGEIVTVERQRGHHVDRRAARRLVGLEHLRLAHGRAQRRLRRERDAAVVEDSSCSASARCSSPAASCSSPRSSSSTASASRSWVAATLGFGAAAVAAWNVLQLVLAVALLVAVGAVVFKLLPNVKQRWSHVIVASTITTLLWIVATLLFRFYVQHFGSYNKTYGTIGGVIVLLTWMYYSMFVLLVGGELASELHHGTGATEPTKGEVVLRTDRLGFGAGTPSLTKSNRGF